MGRNDLIESAGLKDLRDHAGQRADRKLPRSLLERFRQRQNDAQTRAADIRKLLKIHDHSTVAVRNRRGFLALFRLLLRQSGGQLDYGRLAKQSEVSRPAAMSYVEALATAHAAHLLRPFHGAGAREIVGRPKCYAFDTGFVTCEKGWDSIRDDDRGLLWEHLVLDSLRIRFGDAQIFYWRDKSQREVDFVIRRGRDRVDLVECKIKPDNVEATAIEAFRKLYPAGENYVASPGATRSYRTRRGGHVLTVCTPARVH